MAEHIAYSNRIYRYLHRILCMYNHSLIFQVNSMYDHHFMIRDTDFRVNGQDIRGYGLAIQGADVSI